jgi:hypothetical protein
MSSVFLGHAHTVVFHHSASRRSTTREEIRKWHTQPPPNGRGWVDVGYHYVIEADGTIKRGRELHLMGAHAPPNAGRIGVCLTGNNCEPGEEWNAAQIASAIELLGPLEVVFPGIDHAGHRDVCEPGHTICPGLDVRGLFASKR